MRSTPAAMPPCGGAPKLESAVASRQNASTSALRQARSIRTPSYHQRQGCWLRIEPEANLVCRCRRCRTDNALMRQQRILVAFPARAICPPCGIENGLCAKSTFFSSSSPFVKREVDDPAELEAVLVDQVQLLDRQRVRARPANFAELVRLCPRRRTPVIRDQGRVAWHTAPPCLLRARGFWQSGPPNSPPFDKVDIA